MKKTFSSLMSSFHGSCKSSAALPPPILYLSPKGEADDDSCRARAMAAPAVVESRCRCMQRERRRRSAPAIDIGEDDMSRARETPAYLWRKEEPWQVVPCSDEVETVKVDEDDQEEEDEDEVPFAIMVSTKSSRTREMVLQQRRGERNNLIGSRSTISTSSLDSSSYSSEDGENDEKEDSDEHEEDDDEDFGDVDGTSTFLSSLSLTSTINSSVGMPPRNRSASHEPRTASASAVGMLKRLVPAACAASAEEGKVQESFAVVKKSEDPRGDFRRSMAEMVVEKGIYDASDLERLLHCFLSLNSRHHHRAIVSAFSDIWQTLFPEDSPNFSYEQ